MKIFDPTLGQLQRALDARLLRHNVLAGNLANSDTPGFVPRDVDFTAAMREGAGAGLDGNAVDVDRALAAVAENAIQYGAAARAAQKKLAILRYAASDGAA